MATNGYVDVAVTSWDTLRFSWWQNSQSIENNTTTVGWELLLISGSSGAISSSASKKWSVTVNGNNYSGTNTVGVANNTTKGLANGTTTIGHNADGTKAFSFSFSQQFDITFGSWIGTKSGSGSGTLNTIARKSNPTLSASSSAMDSNITIYSNRASTSFTHFLYYDIGDGWQRISGADRMTDNYTWKIPLSFANKVPNGTSLNVTLWLETWNGDTYIGKNSVNFTATVPSSVKPSCTMTLEDITGIDDIYGSPVQGLSKIKITVNPTTAYGSAINSYRITADGKTYSSSVSTTEVLVTAGSSPITATVTDTRGRSGSTSYTMNVQAYTAPTISKLNVYRCNSDGTLNKRGTYIRVIFSASVSSMSNKNTATYKLQYKKTKDSDYTSVTLSALANTFTVTDYSYIFSASKGRSYEVVISVTDRHNASKPAIRTEKVPTASSIFSWRGFKNESGDVEDSAGIGKIPEKANTLQVGWESEFDKPISIFDNSGRQILIQNGTSGTNTYLVARREDTGIELAFGVGSSGVNNGIWSYNLNRWMIYSNGTDVYVNNCQIADSGWVTLHNANNYIIKYRRKNGIVYVVGDASKATENGNLGDGGYKIVATLPSGYRPEIQYPFLFHAVSGDITTQSCYITPAGEIKMYSSKTNVNYWQFSVSFPV